jgi:hypothetical protein
MRESEKRVGRADHNLDGARSAADEVPIDKADEMKDNPDLRAHGTDGQGRDREKLKEEVSTLDEARGSDRGGSASWGSEGAGGSVKDKRPDRAR